MMQKSKNYINKLNRATLCSPVCSFLFFVFLLFSTHHSFSQNLVPNPSFEEKDSCTMYQAGLTVNCHHWFDPVTIMDSCPTHDYCYQFYHNGNLILIGNSSYYNSCNPGHVASTPANLEGFQYPKSGNAYTNIVVITHMYDGIICNEYMNYIEVKLKEPLEKGATYSAEFHYSLCELPYDGWDYFITNLRLLHIGMLFTDTIVKRYPGIGTEQPQNIYVTPQVEHLMGPMANDTANWVSVNGDFIAKGGEEYLTIGSFRKLDTITNLAHTFIYIDDVSVYKIKDAPPDTTTIPLEFKVYPIPAFNHLTIENQNGSLNNVEFQLYNVLGKIVWDEQFTTGQSIKQLDISHLQSGVYFYRATGTLGREFTGKIVVL